MASLLYLKHTFAMSDGDVVERWIENPYWQHFSGERYFRHELPCDPSSLVRWRRRIGEEGCEWLQEHSIKAAMSAGVMKRQSVATVIVDTTVQPKAIAHATDSRLLNRAREQLVHELVAQGEGNACHQAKVKGLEWRYVDLARQHAWIPGSQHKHGKPHAVPLNEIALAVLRRQIGKHPTRVFTFRGEPINQVNTKAWTAALKRAGIEDFRWHDLRHTFATWHRQAGTPTHELQRLGGWKTGAMVERYAHVAPEALQGAAARLDAIAGYGLATPQRPTA